MANYNKIMLMGNLTRDPQLTYLPSNTPVVEFGLAVNRRFKRQDGEAGEETLFIDCRAFGRTAEVINQYLQKGRPVFVEGRLQLDQWQDKEGNKRSKHRVFVEAFQFVDSRDGAGTGGHGPDDAADHSGGASASAPSNYQPRRSAGGPPSRGAAPSMSASEPAPEMPEEDIPF